MTSIEELQLEAADGSPVGLARYWKDRPTIFVFLRHFG